MKFFINIASLSHNFFNSDVAGIDREETKFGKRLYK